MTSIKEEETLSEKKEKSWLPPVGAWRRYPPNPDFNLPRQLPSDSTMVSLLERPDLVSNPRQRRGLP